MRYSSEQTAILFFSKTSQAEANEKKLAVSKRQTASVAQLFIKNTRQILRGIDLPIFTFSEKNQQGNSFGERLHNAFQAVFDKGFQNVIAIGNDCLDLKIGHIEQAIFALKTTPSVLGPSTDGGVYLLGFEKSFFEKTDLKNIQWQTRFVFNELSQIVEKQTVILKTLSDIDTQQDLLFALKRLSEKVKNTLISILQKLNSIPVSRVLDATHRYIFSYKSLRAPPF